MLVKKKRSRLSFCEPDSSRDSILHLPSNRPDELFIKFWKLEGAGTAKGAITIWRIKPIKNQIVSTMGTTIWRFMANDQSNRLHKFQQASLSRQFFLVNK